MLALFTKSWRRKAAIVAVVFYALGLAAPAVAFALTDSGAHCLTETQAKHAGSHHVHDGQAAHDHASPAADKAPAGDDRGISGKCCGTFCLTALAPYVAPVTEPLMQVSAVSQVHVLHLLGHGSDPIDRPPRAFLSI